MSLGFGIGDFVTLGQLAWNVYKACEGVPKSFDHVTKEVLCLHAVLKQFEDSLTEKDLSHHKNLKTVVDGCQDVLRDLQALVERYKSLGTTKASWTDRMGYASQDIAELKSRLTSIATLLAAIFSTSQYTVERKMDRLLKAYQSGRREGSVISCQTLESLSDTEKENWRKIRKELEEVGISVEAFNANKDIILNWIRQAKASGAFQEVSLEDKELNENGYGLNGRQEKGQVHYRSVSLGHEPIVLKSIPSLPSLSTMEGRINPSLLGRPLEEKSSVTKESLIAQFLGYKKRMITAVKVGDEAQVKLLLSKAVSVHTKDEDGLSILHLAAAEGHEPVVKLLLDSGANIDSRSSGAADTTPLFLAVSQGHRNVLCLLLDRNADIDAKSGNNGTTALSQAAFTGNVEFVQVLSERGADLDVEDFSGLIALDHAVKAGQDAVVRAILEAKAAADEETHRAPDQRTLLEVAVNHGYSDAIKLLLLKGGDINATDEKTAKTLLHEAAARGSLEQAMLLSSHGADISAQDCYRLTALDCAVRFGHSAVVTWLLLRLDSVGGGSLDTGRALRIAARDGHKDAAKVLLETEVDVDAKDLDSGQTALRLAVANGHGGLVKLLLNAGADINTMDVSQYTPLYEATSKGDKAMLAILIENKANIDVKCFNEFTALIRATELGYYELVTQLLEAGANVDEKQVKGSTALHLAAYEGNKKVVETLL